MQIQVIYGSQKFPVTLSPRTDIKDQEEQTTSTPESTEPWTLLKVKEEIAKTINVDPKYQRIIHKGKTLFGDGKPITNFNFKPGDKIMVLTGAKPSELTEEDKKLNEFESFIEDKLKSRINDLISRVDGIEKGFVSGDMINAALKEIDKLEKHFAEDCMKTLESLDGIGIGQEANNNCRVKRKALVKNVQELLKRNDDIVDKISKMKEVD